MRKPRSRDGRLADTLLGFGARFSLFLFITIAVAMLLVGRLEPKFLDDSRAALADVAAPFLDLINRPVEAFGKILSWGENLIFVYRENNRLHEENDRLKAWQVAAETLAVENDQLRALLELEEVKARPVAAARVIGQTGGRFFQSVLINAGARAGVAKGNTVADRNGVVGRVITVGRHSARVLLLNDLNSRIPVKILPAGINAILAGDNTRDPMITFLPEGTELHAGDWVVTTGHGGTFPPDMAVGRVPGSDGGGPHRVRLTADFDRLDFVRVLAYEGTAGDAAAKAGGPAP